MMPSGKWKKRLSAILAAIFLVCTPTFAAGRIDFSGFGTPQGPDTEVSTNAVFALPATATSITIALSLDATASNNVEIALGCDDAPTDGELSPIECDFVFSWDCGSWVVSIDGGRTRIEFPPASEIIAKDAELTLTANSKGIAHSFEVFENGHFVVRRTLSAGLETYRWNMLRATARGLGIREKSFAFEWLKTGSKVYFR